MSAIERLGIKSYNDNQGDHSANQEQTSQTFGFKWQKRDTYESAVVQEVSRKWLLKRYCQGQPEKIAEWLGEGNKIIVDAGCGAGYSALIFFGDLLKKNDYLGIDISDAVKVAAKRFREKGIPCDFLQSSLLELPMIPEHSVDMIFAEGVLHHTDDTGKAIKYLSGKLKQNGLFLFYVYAQKAVIREFTDDHIRNAIAGMSDEEAWETLMPLSKLGIALGELKTDIEVPEDIPYLGIKKGRLDIQRFFYWNVCKLFYRPDYTLDEMNHINFDWFRPANCHRHTVDEVIGFCNESQLEIEHLDHEEAGITVVARRK